MSQVLSSSYDHDSGVLDIRLAGGEEYRVTNAGHARKIREKISPGGQLNIEQVAFLERYKLPPRDTAANRAALLAKIRKIREELR